MNLLVGYRIKIDRTLCIACGACYGSNPTHFAPDQIGQSTVIGGEVNENSSSGKFDDDEIKSAKEAQDSCPESAITVTEA